MFDFERFSVCSLYFWCVWIKIDRFERFSENLCASQSHIHQITPTQIRLHRCINETQDIQDSSSKGLPTEPGPQPGPDWTRPAHAHPTRTGAKRKTGHAENPSALPLET